MIDLYKFRDIVEKVHDFICKHVWFLRCVYETKGSSAPITLRNLLLQKILGFNRFIPWPVHRSSRIFGIRWIKLGVNTAPGGAHGCYIFAKEDSPIEIGDYTIVAPNVGIAGFNHDIYDISRFEGKGGVKIGRYCWLGMNAVVLPGVNLGDHTIVAAGAVVTKSFPDGYCVLGGNPARKLRDIERDKVVEHKHPYEYIGYRRLTRGNP